jgi:chromosome segregation ATPase
VRLKNEYISHLEQRNEVSWPEREAALKLEIEDLQKSLTANPDLIRQTMRIAALSAQVEEMEEEMEEGGSEKASERVAALEKDVVQLSEVVHTLLNGKVAAEERMEQLLSENDDRRETIEHLQVMLSDNEFSLAAKDSELAQARDAIAGIEARAAEQQRALEALEVQLRGAVGELETERLHAGKVAESLVALEQEHDELQALQARTAQQAQDLEASVKAATSSSDFSADSAATSAFSASRFVARASYCFCSFVRSLPSFVTSFSAVFFSFCSSLLRATAPGHA